MAKHPCSFYLNSKLIDFDEFRQYLHHGGLEKLLPEYKKVPKFVLTAPNGKVSNIQNETLWRTIRTDEFKNWFGDWERGDVSEINLDTNYEPKTWFRGMSRDDETVIDSRKGKYNFQVAGFFTSSERGAQEYADRVKNGEVREFFLQFENEIFEQDIVYGLDKAEIEYIEKQVGKDIDSIVDDNITENDKAIRALQGLGYDALTTEGNFPYDEIVVFESTQIKSIFNRGTFSATDKSILKMVAPQAKKEAFYSQLEKIVETKMPNKATAQQVKSIINNPQNQIKQAELMWLDIDSFLDTKPIWAKAEVIDFIQANNIQVEEIVKNDKSDEEARQSQIDKVLDILNKYNHDLYLDEFTAQEDNLQLASQTEFILKEMDTLLSNADKSELENIYFDFTARQFANYNENPERQKTKFSQYQLEGEKENYREIAVTLPQEGTPQAIKRGRRIIELEEQRDFESPEYKRLIAKQESISSGWKDGHPEFSDIKNPIVRLRVADRIDADGDKVLMIEEIQPPLKAEFAKMPPILQKYAYHIGLKTAMRIAAENGYKKILWTSGEQQAERYNLQKVVDSIDFSTESQYEELDTKIIKLNVIEGTNLQLTVGTKTGIVTEVYPQNDTTERFINQSLNKIVGEKIAAEILSNDTGTVSGEDLKVGGEGLKNVYDQTVPNIFKKFTKKFTKKFGAKVGTAEIETGDKTQSKFWKNPRIEYHENTDEYEVFAIHKERGGEESLGLFDTNAEALAEVANITDKVETVHALQITDAMRESVMQGQPLFKTDESFPELNDLANQEYLDDAIPLIKSELKTDANGNNKVVVNKEGMALIHAAVASIGGKTRSKEAAFSGLLLSPENTKPQDIINALFNYADAVVENNVDTTALDVLIDNIAEGAVENDIVRIVYKPSKQAEIHETGHQTGEVAASPAGKKIINRVGDKDGKGDVDTFIEETESIKGEKVIKPIVKKIFNGYFKGYGYGFKTKSERAVIVEEIWNNIQTNDYAKMGMSVDDVAVFRYHYLKAYIARNGVESIAKFETFYNSYKLNKEHLDEVKNELEQKRIEEETARNEGTGNAPAISAGKQSSDDSAGRTGDSNVQEDGAGESFQDRLKAAYEAAKAREREAVEEAGGDVGAALQSESKKRGVVKSLEERGYIEEGDITGESGYYDTINRDATKAKAERKVEDLGLAVAIPLAKLPIEKASADESAFRMAVVELLHEQAANATDEQTSAIKMQEAFEVIGSLATDATAYGQAISQLAAWSRENPNTITSYVQKRRIQTGFNEILTTAEADALRKAATDLRDLKASEAKNKDALQGKKREIAYLEKAIKEATVLAETQRLDITELSKNLNTVKRQLGYWKKKANGEIQRRTSSDRKLSANNRELLTNLKAKYDEIKARLTDKFGQNTALKMVAWRFNPSNRPDVSKTDKSIWWHGSDNGDLRGGTSGLHIGTFQAAKEALEARIGVPAQGEWDGTKEYGKTLLAGKNTLDKIEKETGKFVKSGHNAGQDVPIEDYYPADRKERAQYSNGEKVPLNAVPVIEPVKIKGSMTNSFYRPHQDFKANGYMKASLKKGNAKNGYYYKNEAEDYGSISAVVPNDTHLERLWKDVGQPIEDFTPSLKMIAPNGVKIFEGEDAFYEYQEKLDEAFQSVWVDFKSAEEGDTQEWTTIKRNMLVRVWNDFITDGYVKEVESINYMQTRIIKNVAQLEVNTFLMGHADSRKGDPIEVLDEQHGITANEKDLDAFADYAISSNSQLAISDYGLPKVQALTLDLMQATTAETKLKLIDRILNVIHQRSDLAEFFIEGGSTTLNELAGEPNESQSLKMINPTAPDTLTDAEFNDLVDFATMEILLDTPYSELITKLENITNGKVAESVIKDIQMEAESIVYPEKPSTMSTATRERAKVRAAHRREAKAWRNSEANQIKRGEKLVEADLNKPSVKKLSNAELEIISLGKNKGMSDDIVSAAILLGRNPKVSVSELARVLMAENSELSGKQAEEAAIHGAKLRQTVIKTIRARNETAKAEAAGLEANVQSDGRKSGAAYKKLLNIADTLEKPRPTYWKRYLGIFRSALVSAFSTAQINVAGAQIYRKVNTTSDLFELAIAKVIRKSAERAKEGELHKDVQFRDLLGFTGDIKGLGIAQIVGRNLLELRSAAILAASPESVSDARFASVSQTIANQFPEETAELDRAYNADIAVHREVAEQSFKERSLGKKIDYVADNGFHAAEWTFDKANTLNKLQEFYMRDIEFARSLQKRVAIRGLKLDDIIAQKAWHLIKPSEVMKATDEALKVTFARRPERGTVSATAISLVNDHVVFNKILPFIAMFPNFMYNAVNVTAELTPGVGLIKSARANQKALGKQASFVDGIKGLNAKDAANQIVGTIIFLTALQMVRAFGDDDDWKKLRVPGMKASDGKPMYVDVSNWFPLTPFIYMANKFNRIIGDKPLFPDTDGDAIALELAEGLLGISNRNITNNEYLNTLKAIGRNIISSDSKDSDRMWHQIALLGGNHFGSFLRPLKVLRDVVAVFDETEQKQLDLADYPFEKGLANNLPFGNAILKTIGAQEKKRLDGSAVRVEAPLARIFGLNISNSDFHRNVPSRFLAALKDIGEFEYEKDILPNAQRQRFYKGQLYQMIREAGSDKVKQDKIKEAIKQLIKDGVFTADQLEKVESSIGLTELQQAFLKLSVNPLAPQGARVAEAMKLATPQEKKEIQKMLDKKQTEVNEKVVNQATKQKIDSLVNEGRLPSTNPAQIKDFNVKIDKMVANKQLDKKDATEIRGRIEQGDNIYAIKSGSSPEKAVDAFEIIMNSNAPAKEKNAVKEALQGKYERADSDESKRLYEESAKRYGITLTEKQETQKRTDTRTKSTTDGGNPRVPR